MTNQQLGLIALLPSIAAIGTALSGLAVLAVRHLRPVEPLEPDAPWADDFLHALQGTPWETVFTSPSGLHEVIAPRAYEQIAEHGEYVARHCEEEIPPSTWPSMLRLTVVERAKALTHELNNINWRPSRPYRTHSFA